MADSAPTPALPGRSWWLLLVGAFLLFANLGRYALWDDEALTALGALGILETGDTSATVHGQLVAFRNGFLIRNGFDRSTPPLSQYLPASTLALFGRDSAWAARLPFALCGLIAIAIVIGWSRRDRSSFAARWLPLVLVLNVSFMLYARQCRYYMLGLLLSLIAAKLWLTARSIRGLVLCGLATGALFASSPIAYAAFMGTLVLDQLLFRDLAPRHSLKNWLAFGLAQAPFVAVVFAIWNPLRTGVVAGYGVTTIADRLVLLWWSLRDLTAAEFYAGPLAVIAAIFALRTRDHAYLREFLAFVAYCGCVALITPQSVHDTSVADIRYHVALIPLGVWISLRALDLVTKRLPADVRTFALVVLIGSNFFHGAGLLPGGLRSTQVKYLTELVWPIDEPFTPTARWIRTNVPDGSTIWVQPDHMVYPLMFQAPNARYAWQLSNPPPPNVADPLPEQIKGNLPPEYVIHFGPFAETSTELLRPFESEGKTYAKAATLPHLGKDLYRPELFWRTFRTVSIEDPEGDSIQIHKLSSP